MLFKLTVEAGWLFTGFGRQQNGRVIDKTSQFFEQVCAWPAKQKNFIYVELMTEKQSTQGVKKHVMKNLQHKQLVKITKIIASYY